MSIIIKWSIEASGSKRGDALTIADETVEHPEHPLWLAAMRLLRLSMCETLEVMTGKKGPVETLLDEQRIAFDKGKETLDKVLEQQKAQGRWPPTRQQVELAQR